MDTHSYAQQRAGQLYAAQEVYRRLCRRIGDDPPTMWQQAEAERLEMLMGRLERGNA